jgi:hypothetical protein
MSKKPKAARKQKAAAVGGPPLLLLASIAVAALATGVAVWWRYGSVVEDAAAAAQRKAAAAPWEGPPAKHKSGLDNLQEGRIDGKQRAERAKCVDRPRSNCELLERNPEATELCNTDAATRADCCKTCHRLACKDKSSSCQEWSQSGQCYQNKEFMLERCCYSCSPDPDDACSPDPAERPDVAEGDVDKIFERALENFPHYKPNVFSRDPWLVQFDDLLTDEECAGIIEAVCGRLPEQPRAAAPARRSARPPLRRWAGKTASTSSRAPRPSRRRTSTGAWS